MYTNQNSTCQEETEGIKNKLGDPTERQNSIERIIQRTEKIGQVIEETSIDYPHVPSRGSCRENPFFPVAHYDIISTSFC